MQIQHDGARDGARQAWHAKVGVGALPPGLSPGQPLAFGFRADDAWVF
jgi:hypothetical protein